MQTNEIKWNNSQKIIINKREGNMLVSASAGSGKTTVMLERALKIIESGVPIERICILAFNNSIASEIRQKLYKKLLKKIEERAAKGDTTAAEYLAEQLDNVNMATIVTNDAFCNKLVKEFFQLIDADANSEILGQLESDKMYSDSYNGVVENLKAEGKEWIYDLAKKFNGEQGLAAQINKINAFASVHPNKRSWIDNIKSGIYDVELKDSAAMNYFRDIIRKKCDFGLTELDKMSLLVHGNAKLTANADEGRAILETVKSAKDYDALYFAAHTAKFPDRARITKTHEFFSFKGEIEYSYNCARYVLEWLCEFLSDTSYAYLSDIHRKTSKDVMYLFRLYELTEAEYSAKKRRANRTDFAEISAKAVKLLEDDKIAAELKERYDYICVDEYQDTNYLQEYMFSRISNGKNLFMVGDSKQSIYRFRMSEPQILINKFNAYDDDSNLGAAVHLDDNYRSDIGIVDFVNDIFNVIMSKNIGGVDYFNTDKLGYGAKYEQLSELPAVDIAMFQKPVKSDAPSEVNYLDAKNAYSVLSGAAEELVQTSQEMEARYIAEHIKSIVGKKKIYDIAIKEERLIKYSDCVILSSSGGETTKKIIKTVQSYRIPIDSAALIKLNRTYEVEILNDWLKVIDSDMQDLPLTAVLTGFWCGLTYQELTDIRNENKQCEFFYEACKNSRADNEKLASFYELLQRLRIAATTQTVADILKILVYGYGYDKHLLTLEDGEFKLNAVKSYINAVEGVSKSTSLSEYVAGLGDVKADSTSESNGDVVRAMTIHKSKGLEFPIVYLCNVSDELNKAKGTNTPRLECNNEIGVAINYFDETNKKALNNFVFKVLKEKNKIEQQEEKMRLFYVALTRAKNHLIITGSVTKSKIERKNPYKVNSFWDWIGNAAAENYKIANRVKFYDEYSAKVGVMEQYSFKKTDIKFPLISETLDFSYPSDGGEKINIKYSVTEINQLGSYEDVIENAPNDYDEDEIFNGDRAIRGTNYHSIFEYIDYESNSIEDITVQLDKMVKDGVLRKEDISTIEKQEILRVLKSDVIKYAAENKHYRERDFMLCVPACEVINTDCAENILVQGAIDLIIDGEKLIIVDFKKSNASTEKLRSRYRKQLELYAMAAENALCRRVDIKLLYVIGRDEIIVM